MRVATYQGAEPLDHASAVEKAVAVAGEALARGARIVCLPECFITGYSTDPAEARERALSLKGEAFASVLARLGAVETTVIVGLIEEGDDGALYNTAALVRSGRLVGHYRKRHVNERVFAPGRSSPVFRLGNTLVGINICNDANYPDAAKELADAGATVIFYPLNNLLRRGTADAWRDTHVENLVARAQETGCWVVSADIYGETEATIGYGFTMIVDPHGRVRSRSRELAEDLLVLDIGGE